MTRVLFLSMCCMMTLHSFSQESVMTYSEAISLVKKTPIYKELDMPLLTSSSTTISFTNQAYAFWLDGLDTRFAYKDFEKFFGDLYQPIEIISFEKVRDTRRSKYQLYVSETENDLFVIEMLSRKRKRKAKYPTFYQGKSTSFLFEKKENGGVRLIETLTVQSN